MRIPPAPTRRHLLSLLVSTAFGSLMRGARAAPDDRGIGGTGAAPSTDANDRGIGGTGVIGTIRKFGSIYVNDLRIAYADDAEIRIDGRPAAASDLRLGQVVRVEASGAGAALATRRIDVTSEVVGPVGKVSGKTMIVLGQKVSTAGSRPPVRVGDTVAVSGLRRNDGVIVASLVERREGAPSRVAGPVDVGPDGAMRIGALALSGVDPSLIGRRAILDGQIDGDRFAVSRGVAESTLLTGVRTLSVESYVERRGDELSLGSGFRVSDASGFDLPVGRSVRAVLTTNVGADGRLGVESVRTGSRTYDGSGGSSTNGPAGDGHGGSRGSGSSGPGGAGNSNGAGNGNGRVPMDFGHGPSGGAGGSGAGGSGNGGGGSRMGGGNGMGGSGPGGGGPGFGGGGPGGFGGGGPGGFGGGGPGGGGGGRR